ncbi:MAG: response regulator [Bacteriovoracaceae bacterium]
MTQRLRRILLVEDSPHDAELTIEALSENNLVNDIIHVSDGEQALDYLLRRGKFIDRTNEVPAVVLMDIKMPKVDGIEVLRIMKSTPELMTIPVVMLTSSREENDLIGAYKLGVNAYVVKPVDFSAFTQAVSQLGLFWAIINETPGEIR